VLLVGGAVGLDTYGTGLWIRLCHDAKLPRRPRHRDPPKENLVAEAGPSSRSATWQSRCPPAGPLPPGTEPGARLASSGRGVRWARASGLRRVGRGTEGAVAAGVKNLEETLRIVILEPGSLGSPRELIPTVFCPMSNPQKGGDPLSSPSSRLSNPARASDLRFGH